MWLAAIGSSARKQPTHWENTFLPTDLLELRVFLSPEPRFVNFNDSTLLKWHQTGIPYNMAAEERSVMLEIPTSDHLLSNRSVYAHSFFSKQGVSLDPKDPTYDKSAITHNVFPLTTAGERIAPIGLHNLLTGEPAPWEEELRRGISEDAETGKTGQHIPYWKPRLYLQLIVDHEVRSFDEMPFLYEDYLRAHGLIKGNRYRPLVYVNELMVMRMHWIAINQSLVDLPLEITFKPLPANRFHWMVNLQTSFRVNEEKLGITEKESEDMRGMFVNTNPVLLYTTVAVSHELLGYLSPQPSHLPHYNRSSRSRVTPAAHVAGLGSPPALRRARLQERRLLLALSRHNGGALFALACAQRDHGAHHPALPEGAGARRGTQPLELSSISHCCGSHPTLVFSACDGEAARLLLRSQVG